MKKDHSIRKICNYVILEVIAIILLYFILVFPIKLDYSKITYVNNSSKTSFIYEYHNTNKKMTTEEQEIIKNRLDNLNIFELNNVSFNDSIKVNIMVDTRHKRANGSIELIGNYGSTADLNELITLINLKQLERGEGRLYTSGTNEFGSYTMTVKNKNTFSLVINTDIYSNNSIANANKSLLYFLDINKEHISSINKKLNIAKIEILGIIVIINILIYIYNKRNKLW